MICSISSCDPAFLMIAWDRVASKGCPVGRGRREDRWLHRKVDRGEGVPGGSAFPVEGAVLFSFPGSGEDDTEDEWELRRLGIPTVEDRVVQGALKLVLEPYLRGGFQAVLVWVPAEKTRA